MFLELVIMEIEKAHCKWQFNNNMGLEIPFICSSTCPSEHIEQGDNMRKKELNLLY